MAGGRGLPLPGAPVVWGLADAVHEPVLYLSENKTGNRHVQAGRVGRIPQQRPPGREQQRSFNSRKLILTLHESSILLK